MTATERNWLQRQLKEAKREVETWRESKQIALKAEVQSRVSRNSDDHDVKIGKETRRVAK